MSEKQPERRDESGGKTLSFLASDLSQRGNRKHTDMAAAGGAEVALAPRLGMTIAGEAIHRRGRDELRRHTFGKCGMENSECAVSIPADGATAEVCA